MKLISLGRVSALTCGNGNFGADDGGANSALNCYVNGTFIDVCSTNGKRAEKCSDQTDGQGHFGVCAP